MNPLVSVIVPTFDGQAFVREAIESILEQSYEAVEILVCDDGSSDGTVRILESLGDRIRLLLQENQGVSEARNRAARAARGTLLAFLDQDDLWEPDMLETQVALLERAPDCGLVYGDSWVVDSAGTVRDRRSSFLRYEEGHVFRSLLGGNFIPIETLVVRAELFREHGGFDTRWKFLEDYALCLRIARACPIRFTPRPIARYRVHDRNVTHEMEAILLEYVEILEGLGGMFPDLSEEERARADRELRERFCELAWYALRRGDVEACDRWLERNATGCSGPLARKIRLLRSVERVLPAWATRRLVALFPRRRMYGL